MNERHIIVLDGIDGSGKSHLAQRLLAACAAADLRAALLRVDDFRRPMHWDQIPDETAAYWEQYYDFAALAAEVDRFLAGAGTAQLLVVEGVFPLRVTSTAAVTLVYLDTSAAEARRRIIERDMPKGRTRAEVERRIDRRYVPNQQRYHREFKPRDRAHLILDNEDLAAPRLVLDRLADRPLMVRRALAAVIPAPR